MKIHSGLLPLQDTKQRKSSIWFPLLHQTTSHILPQELYYSLISLSENALLKLVHVSAIGKMIQKWGAFSLQLEDLVLAIKVPR